MNRAARFAAVLGTLHAAHNVADHVLQTDHQALHKADADGWERAMAGHVGSYHAAQVAALATADRALGLGLSPRRVAAAVAVSAATHAFLDRRWPVKRALKATGSPGFSLGQFLPPAEPIYTCPECGREAPWTDGTMTTAGDARDEFWCQTCGAETPLDVCQSRSALVIGAWPVPLHGPYLADQALHHGVLWLCALIVAGGAS